MGLNQVAKFSSPTLSRMISRQSFHTVPQLTSILSIEFVWIFIFAGGKGDKDVKKEIKKTRTVILDFSEKICFEKLLKSKTPGGCQKVTLKLTKHAYDVRKTYSGTIGRYFPKTEQGHNGRLLAQQENRWQRPPRRFVMGSLDGLTFSGYYDKTDLTSLDYSAILTWLLPPMVTSGARGWTEWFRVVAWDKLGEICNQYLTKGTRVYVEGRLQTRKWQDKEGQDRYTTEVIASDMIILSSRQDRQSAPDYEAPPEEEFSAAPAPSRAPAARPAERQRRRTPGGTQPRTSTQCSTGDRRCRGSAVLNRTLLQ